MNMSNSSLTGKVEASASGLNNLTPDQSFSLLDLNGALQEAINHGIVKPMKEAGRTIVQIEICPDHNAVILNQFNPCLECIELSE